MPYLGGSVSGFRKDEVVTQLNVQVVDQKASGLLHTVRKAVSRTNWSDVGMKAALVVAFTAIVYAGLKMTGSYNPFAPILGNPVGRAFAYFAGVYSTLMLSVTAIRALMVFSYRPMRSLTDEELPTVSVIIPAYNEGPDVAKSIESIARSNYPRHKLQIITIDDGSKDDTWEHMNRMAERYPDMVCAIRMEKNGGKRQGMRVGFALAAGDVVLTMDSDSVVDRDSVRNLVTPIAADPRIGGVAGNVKVLNRDAGIIPKMLRASFVLAFDFQRAYQAKIGAVQCTPGAFSAYRRSAVESVLHDWNNQSWRGKPATIAEDRALSNLILREGHEITFQSNAVVWTNVPTKYNGLSKMFQRWERGNIRENLTYCTFGWKKFRERYWLLANIDFLLNFGEMFFPYMLIAASLLYALFNPFFLIQYLAYTIIFSGIMQMYTLYRERDSDFIYGVLYSIFWFTCMWWVVPYSVITASNGSWMTRQLPATAAPAATPTGLEVAGGNQTPERLAA